MAFKVGDNRGERNIMWKGNRVGLDALHAWVRKRLTKPEECSKCKEYPPYDLANISQEYKRNISDWEWLCRKCHMISDGRLKNLRAFYKPRQKKISICYLCKKEKRIYGKLLCHKDYDRVRYYLKRSQLGFLSWEEALTIVQEKFYSE